jgi:hypothetical protein
MGTLVDTLDRYAASFLREYGHRLSDGHRHAFSAMRRCRTPHYGQLQWQCPSCEEDRSVYRSCGHRSCHRCQNHDNTRWLERQQTKLLPVGYYLLTFTLPAECRTLAWHNQDALYRLLFECAVSTCRDFARRDKHLQGEIGMSAVLHTQTRRLDYHPHVHVIIPGGAINKTQRCWRTAKGRYLFSHKALATVFRARMLEGLRALDLLPAQPLPKRWVVDCRRVGDGLPALKYLSRYLYRGVISERQLISDDGKSVTFSYRDGQSGKTLTRTVSGPRFIWLLIQHVLPTGFRRVRDYGFLHGNARRTLIRVQWFLRVPLSVIPEPSPRPPFACSHCGESMRVVGITPALRLSG